MGSEALVARGGRQASAAMDPAVAALLCLIECPALPRNLLRFQAGSLAGALQNTCNMGVTYLENTSPNALL